MDPIEKPVNFLIESKKIFLFFGFCFIFFFLVLSLNQVFSYFRKQLRVFETQSQVLKEGLPIAPDVLSSTPGVEAPLGFVLTEKPDSLEIPRLSLVVPLVFSKSSQAKEIAQDLLRGVAVYPGSSLSDRPGRFLVLGHSAPPGFPKIKYYWVFSRLDELAPGDEIFVIFERKQYRFRVTRKMFLEKGEEIPGTPDVDGKTSAVDSRRFLYLITCWPPGRDIRRLAVEAVALTNQ